ncbi:MAG: 4-hydroxy-3-methylbut-2-enyl diphosphate reductase [Candidatus Calescibacterium sp.]|nr:4-hydroxy-3-methylbut-2-enyl diphosphate reductase [Candidatus Calescibacterium sp.]MCX7972028.1 4-hydroxy-3-methylbut-2-enyl diphosphate reductase [bacterium]MDW8194688.1 4-hydroxy-3-methylbut-2-enyl diphosphate reductase [Candidatus Calescibacterium sp.]
MEIFLAEKMGFCFGVKRTVDIAMKIIENKEKNVVTFGPIIHNEDLTDYLKKNGINYVNSLTDIDVEKTEKVIIRTHGAKKEVIDTIKKMGIKVIDGTCPYVMRVHRIVEKLSKENYPILIIGNKDHPEIIGVIGYIQGDVPYFVVKNVEEVEELRKQGKFDKFKKIGIVTQTTEKIDKVRKIVNYLMDFIPEVRYFKTICYATDENQQAIHKLAPMVDIVIVIGGKHSSNTIKLYEIAKSYCKRTYHIQNEKDLRIEWFKHDDKVGITAGASTPDWVIKNVIDKIKEFDQILGGKEIL